jgi:LAO/AO transport system kinase
MTMGDWRPPIIQGVASEGTGVDDLWAEIGRHKGYLSESGELQKRRQKRLLDELRRVMVSKIEHEVKANESGSKWQEVKTQLLKRDIDPYQAAENLLSEG